MSQQKQKSQIIDDEDPVTPWIKGSFQAARGVRDILPNEQKFWQFARQAAEEIARIFGFRRIDVPTFENAALFDRSIGSQTDIIAKELYLISGKDEIETTDKLLALRPEFTAGIARAYIENGLQFWPQPIKLFTIGSVFRHEKPQKGRYREHFQIDFEILGDDSAKADAWIILSCWELLTVLGIKNIEIQINSLGNAESQEKYRKKLKSYYKPLLTKLCSTCLERYEKNILRILDCKEVSCIKHKENAPTTIDNLNDASKKHFMAVLNFLDSFNVAYSLNPYIVRGLDYYTHTAFEILVSNAKEDKDQLKGAHHQLAIGGGGRYDDLMKQIGGNATCGVGVALGLDRLVEIMKKQKVQVKHQSHTEIFVSGIGARALTRAKNLVLDLLRAGFATEFAPDKPSFRSQLKTANKLEANYTIIIGEREAHDNTCIIRDMKSGIQEDVSCDELVSILNERLR